MTLRFIFHYPESHGLDADLLGAGPLLEVAIAAESAGFDGFSLSEHPVPGARWMSTGGHQTFDPLIALSCVAGATQRIRLVTDLRDSATARGRSEAIDVTYSYPDRSITVPNGDIDRHGEALAEIERSGVTWVVISSDVQEPARTFDFIEAFGATYLS